MKRVFKKLIFLILLILGCSQSAFAQDGYTLFQLEEMLWGANPSVEAAFRRMEAVLYEQEEAMYLFSPELSFSSNFYPSGRTSADRQYLDNTIRTTVGLYFPIIKGWRERCYTTMEKKAQGEEKKAELELVKNEMLFALRQKYFQTLTAQQLVQVYNKGNLALKEILHEVRHKRRQRRVLLSDVLYAEKRLLQLRQNMTVAQDNYMRQKAALAALLGMDEAELILEQNPSFSLPSLPVLSDLLELAFKNNPRSQILEARRDVESTRAAKAYLNNVNLQFVTGYTVENERYAGTDQGSFLGLNLSVPLSYLKVSSLQKQQALSRKKGWEAEQDLAKHDLKNQLKVAYQQVKRLYTEYQLIDKQKQEAEARRRQIKRRKQYSPTGEIDYQQLIQAEMDFWEAQAQLSKKDWERFIAFYHVFRIAGLNEPLPVSFMPPGPSPLDFSLEKLCLRTLLIQNVSYSPAEIEFFAFFCQTKGIGRVFLPESCLNEREGLPELLSQLSQNKISAYIHLDLRDKKEALDVIHGIINFNEQNIWRYNLRGIYLIADFDDIGLKKVDYFKTLEGVKKILQKSAQNLKLILQVFLPSDIDGEDWRQIIGIADELAFSHKAEKIPEQMEVLLRQSNKYYWRVLHIKDFADQDEYELETEIEQFINKKTQTMGVVLDNYQQYRELITR